MRLILISDIKCSFSFLLIGFDFDFDFCVCLCVCVSFSRSLYRLYGDLYEFAYQSSLQICMEDQKEKCGRGMMMMILEYSEVGTERSHFLTNIPQFMTTEIRSCTIGLS
ncbi:hypothetical protein CsSME_00008361 [Camellia sinensis var. sinensis]